MKCVLYARVSTEEQAKKYSVPAQLDLLRNFARINDYQIFKEYVDEDMSGTTADRPRLQELLSDARKRMIDVVLVYRIDRFFRNTKLLLILFEVLIKIARQFQPKKEKTFVF